MINNKGKVQKGGMLLEAITVLGLIAVSAPSIYKKNIERTEEIRDISKASQLRMLKDAASSYIEKQYEQIVRDSATGDSVVEINTDELVDHLPSGFNIPSGVRVYINTRKEANTGANASDSRPLSLVSALVVDNEDIDETRAGKVVRMIGAEGGYSSDDGMVRGNKGIWEINKASGVYAAAGIADNRVVVSSTYSKNMSSSDYIYRNKVEGYPEANMMFTNVDMNGNSIERIGRLAFRYNNGDKWADVDIGGADEGSTGGTTRDNGLSLMFHGERGEIVGKSRTEADTGDRYEWEDKDDLTNVTHLTDKVTVELASGGPESEGDLRNGYLRLRNGLRNPAFATPPSGEYGCTRIESNYRMPILGNTMFGETNGGAFIACSDLVSENIVAHGVNPTENRKFNGAHSATLAGDDKVGNAYMIVTNPLNNRRAVMYGNYQRSFFNSAYRNQYRGGALEGVNNNNVVTTLLASQMSSTTAGADKGETHTADSSLLNLSDSGGILRSQLRADSEGGYAHLYDQNNSSPTVSFAGSKNNVQDRSYSVTTKRTGYARMQADYDGNDSSNSGAFVLKRNAGGNELAVMSSSITNSGYFVLKEDGRDKFKTTSENAQGGSMYFANRNNFAQLSSNINTNKTVEIESIKNGQVGGNMIVSNPHNAGKIEVTANYSTSSPAQNGPGLLATNRRDLNTVKLHTNATGNTSNSAGGSLILSNTVGGTQTRAELLTSSNQEGTGNGGTLAMYSGTSRNILASAKGPNASGWMSVSRGSSRGVDIFGDYNGRGAGVILTNGENSNNTGLATSVSKVEMLAGGQYNASTFNSPVVTVRGSDRDSNVSIYGNINQSNSVLAAASRKGGGISFRDTAGNEDTFLVGNNNTPNGAGGWARIGNNGSQGVDIYADHSGQGAKMYVGGGVNFHSSFNGNNNPSMITASDLRASAKVKVGGGSGAAGSVSANTVKTLVLSANSFNNKGGGYIGNFLFEHIRPHMGSYASAPTKIGHWRCIVSEKNCPIYNNQGEIIDYVGAESYATWGKHSDVFAGRVHDYSLYAYGEITVDGFNYSHTNDARHFGEYDVWSRPRHTVLSGNRLQTQKGVMEGPFSDSQKHSYMTQWHDNLSGRNDDGPWSKWQANELFPGQTYSDQVPSTWNGQDPNY